MRATLIGVALAALFAASAGAAFGRLPPPTPEEVARKQAAAEKKAKEEEAARKALERAQDRVAARYRQKKGR